jgi:hypothetical protein
MLIDGTDPFAIAKPDARLIKLLIRAHRFGATLVGGAGMPFAALAKQEGVSRSYFTRLVRLSYLASDTFEPALRYWNLAQQRRYSELARSRRRITVSVSHSACHGPHTRAESPPFSTPVGCPA